MKEQITAAIQTTKHRNNWIDYINDEKFEYFITLTFTRPLSDRVSVDTIQQFIRRLISYCPRKKRPLVSGIIVTERTKTNMRFDGHLHFHILIKGINANILKPLVWLHNKVYKCAATLRTFCGKNLCNTSTVDFKHIYESSGLAKYLAKDVRYPFNDLGDSIWPFDHKGVQYIFPEKRYNPFG